MFIKFKHLFLNNLLKERQILRQTRETHSDKDKLKPLLFAGVLIEGGIVGYDTNTMTGGIGARLLGIGAQDEDMAYKSNWTLWTQGLQEPSKNTTYRYPAWTRISERQKL